MSEELLGLDVSLFGNSADDDDSDSGDSSQSAAEDQYNDEENKDEDSDEYVDIGEYEDEEEIQCIEGKALEVKIIDLNSTEFFESEDASNSGTELPSSFYSLNISPSANVEPSTSKDAPPKRIIRKLGPIYDDDKDTDVGDLTELVLKEEEDNLIRVDYPAYVKDYNKMLQTLGGPEKLAAAFNGDFKKRLELKFRPWDLYAKPAYGDKEETCGVLIKVRRKKVKEPAKKVEEPKLIKPKKLTEEEVKKILEEEREMFNQIRFKSKETNFKNYKKKKGHPKASGSRRYFIKTSDEEQKKSDLKIEVVGITSNYFSFNGLCDFQYLPTKLINGKLESIEKNIFPLFGDPDKGQTFVADSNESPDNKNFCPEFIIPNVMARFDRPHKNPISLFEEPISSNEPQINLVKSTREKRITFAHMFSFLVSPKDPYCEKTIPTEPMEQAISDVSKKFLLGVPVEVMKHVFERQPIWSKLALEVETKKTQNEIRYLLPCVAYFALNGPWRSLWIRLGYDPRNHPTAFAFQLLDYRVPQQYKSAIIKANADESISSSTSDTLNINTFSFIRGTIPPKTQMFYQLCNVHITEIEQVRATIYHKIRHDPRAIPYSPRFGFLSDALLDFCRYSISRHIEVELMTTGKIRTATFPVLSLNADGTVPKAALKSAISGSKEKKKRIRLRKQVTTPAFPDREKPSTSKAAIASLAKTRPVRQRRAKIEQLKYVDEDDQDDDDDDDPDYVEEQALGFEDPVVSELLG